MRFDEKTQISLFLNGTLGDTWDHERWQQLVDTIRRDPEFQNRILNDLLHMKLYQLSEGVTEEQMDEISEAGDHLKVFPV